MTGFTGIKCAACERGYTLSGSGTCDLCPNESLNTFLIILCILAEILVCVIIVKSSIKSAFTPSAVYSIYIKIFTNYMQLVFLTSQFHLS